MGIYPTINLPRLIRPTFYPRGENDTEGLQPSFDFLSGDFLLNAGRPILINGKEAFEQWCLKICMTERKTRLAYSEKIGVELMNLAKLTDREQIKSQIIRTLTEAILVHPRAKAVKDFSFAMVGDEVRVSFEVQSDFGESRLEAGI